MRARVELAKGAGYFLFRGGEAEEWIDRTVRVPTIGSLTLEQWLNESRRLKALNVDLMKAAKQPSPRAAKPQREPHEAPARRAPIHPAPPREPAPPRDSTRREAAASKLNSWQTLPKRTRACSRSRNRRCVQRERAEFRISSPCLQLQRENAANSTAACLPFGITL